MPARARTIGATRRCVADFVLHCASCPPPYHRLRVLGPPVTPKPQALTLQYCAQLCHDRALPLAGVEESDCICGTKVDARAKNITGAKACATPCSGNATEHCGGNYQLAVFSFSCSGSPVPPPRPVPRPPPPPPRPPPGPPPPCECSAAAGGTCGCHRAAPHALAACRCLADWLTGLCALRTGCARCMCCRRPAQALPVQQARLLRAIQPLHQRFLDLLRPALLRPDAVARCARCRHAQPDDDA